MAYSGLRLLGVACLVVNRAMILNLQEMELSVIAKVGITY